MADRTVVITAPVVRSVGGDGAGDTIRVHVEGTGLGQSDSDVTYEFCYGDEDALPGNHAVPLGSEECLLWTAQMFGAELDASQPAYLSWSEIGEDPATVTLSLKAGASWIELSDATEGGAGGDCPRIDTGEPAPDPAGPGCDISGPGLSRGAHVLDAARALVARIRARFTDAAEDEFTALRAPVEIKPGSGEPTVRVPNVVSGWIDPAQREMPAMPFIAIRPGSARAEKIAGQDARIVAMVVVIACHCPAVADYEYAWAIAERIWLDLASAPHLGEGQYGVDADGIAVDESGELIERWQAYVLVMSVPVVLPAFARAAGPDGKPGIWENEYGRREGGIGIEPE